MHIVYLISCNICTVQYVGCATRALHTRIGEHINNVKRIQTFMCNVSIASKHFIDKHDRDLSTFSVTAIERVNKPYRGGD